MGAFFDCVAGAASIENALSCATVNSTRTVVWGRTVAAGCA